MFQFECIDLSLILSLVQSILAGEIHTPLTVLVVVMPSNYSCIIHFPHQDSMQCTSDHELPRQVLSTLILVL